MTPPYLLVEAEPIHIHLNDKYLKHMKNNIHKFLIYLFTMVIVITVVIRWVLLEMTEGGMNLFMHQLCRAFYFCTPVLSVLIIEKWKVRKIIIDYRLTLKNINTGVLIKYILLTSIIYPAVILLLIYVFGNLIGINEFGKIVLSNNGHYEIAEIILSNNIFVRFFILWAIMIISGLTFNMITALCGEFAWRGFLEININASRIKKNSLIGLIWGIWSIPLILSSQDSFLNLLLKSGMLILVCIASSFYFADALKKTKTLFTSAALQGIILSSYFMSFSITTGDASSLIVGKYGLLAFFAIVAMAVFVPCLVDRSKSSKKQ